MTRIQQIQKMVMAGKNYLVNECADILWKITGFGTRIGRYHNIYGLMELLMAGGKILQLFVER